MARDGTGPRQHGRVCAPIENEIFICIYIIIIPIENETNDEVWLHLDERAGPSYMNSMDNAKTIVEAGDVASRASELPSLAKKGMKQYCYNVKTMQVVKRRTQATSVQLEAELNPEE